MNIRLGRSVAVVVMLLGLLASPSAAETLPFDVVAENAQSGTRNWQIDRRAFTQKTLAYSRVDSVLAGTTVDLFVRCTASTYIVQALRIGDYQGDGARRVWQSPALPCQAQPPARIDRSTNTAVAKWTRTLTIDTTGWPEGAYLLKVQSSDKSATFVNLFIQPESVADRVVFISSTLTFQAYNAWGGANAYRGTGGFSTRARILSFDRPQTWGYGSGKFLTYEAPIIRRAEAAGIALVVLTDAEVSRNPSLLDGARAIVFGGHSEYWTQSLRDAVLAARDNGVNLLFFGANTAYWRVRLSDSRLGAHRTMAIYKTSKEDPGRQPTIRFRDLGQPDAELTGVTYSCFPAKGDFTIVDPTSWVFDGTNVKKGQTFRGIVATEVDKLLKRAPNVAVLASTPTTCGARKSHSTMILRSETSGAFTFATGTMGWVSKAMRGSGGRATQEFVNRVTENLLVRAASA